MWAEFYTRALEVWCSGEGYPARAPPWYRPRLCQRQCKDTKARTHACARARRISGHRLCRVCGTNSLDKQRSWLSSKLGPPPLQEGVHYEEVDAGFLLEVRRGARAFIVVLPTCVVPPARGP